MSDEIKTTTIRNPRKIEAPEPPAIVVSAIRDAKGETELEAIKRRLAALEHAVNGKVSE